MFSLQQSGMSCQSTGAWSNNLSFLFARCDCLPAMLLRLIRITLVPLKLAPFASWFKKKLRDYDDFFSILTRSSSSYSWKKSGYTQWVQVMQQNAMKMNYELVSHTIEFESSSSAARSVEWGIKFRVWQKKASLVGAFLNLFLFPIAIKNLHWPLLGTCRIY